MHISFLTFTFVLSNHLIPKKLNINNNGSTPIVPMKYVISLSVLFVVVIVVMLILGNR